MQFGHCRGRSNEVGARTFISYQMMAESLAKTDGHIRYSTVFTACNNDALCTRGKLGLSTKINILVLQYSTAVPKKRVNSPSTISCTKASHLCIIFFTSITIILTDSRDEDKSISSPTAMIQGSCSVFDRQYHLIAGTTLYL